MKQRNRVKQLQLDLYLAGRFYIRRCGWCGGKGTGPVFVASPPDFRPVYSFADCSVCKGSGTTRQKNYFKSLISDNKLKEHTK